MADQAPAHDEYDLGLVSLTLTTNWQSWVHRRVERIEFLDTAQYSRSASIDFTVPEGLGWEAIHITPLTLIKKSIGKRTVPLKSLDVQDESGRSLPVLQSTQNRAVGRAMLEIDASRVLRKARRGALDPSVISDISALIDADAVGGRLAWERLAVPKPNEPRANRQRGALVNDHQWYELARIMAETFVLHAVIEIPLESIASSDFPSRNHGDAARRLSVIEGSDAGAAPQGSCGSRWGLIHTRFSSSPHQRRWLQATTPRSGPQEIW